MRLSVAKERPASRDVYKRQERQTVREGDVELAEEHAQHDAQGDGEEVHHRCEARVGVIARDVYKRQDFHAVYLFDDCAGFHPGVGCVEGAFLHYLSLIHI